MQHRSG